MKLTPFLEERGKFFWGLLGGLVVLLLGIINYFLGFELNTSFFYFIPIAAVAWYAGRERPGRVLDCGSASRSSLEAVRVAVLLARGLSTPTRSAIA